MTRRQRNNISRMPWDHRRIVCKMLVEGATYADIRAALVKAGETLTAHNNSIHAYSESAEYAEYANQARDYRRELDTARMSAAMINDGEGPGSLADLATYSILQELNRVIRGGDYDPRDLVKLANAVANQSRAEVLRAASDRKDEIAKLKADHAAEIEGLNNKLIAAHAEAAKLRTALDKKAGGVDPVSRKEIVAAVDEFIRGDN